MSTKSSKCLLPLILGLLFQSGTNCDHPGPPGGRKTFKFTGSEADFGPGGSYGPQYGYNQGYFPYYPGFWPSAYYNPYQISFPDDGTGGIDGGIGIGIDPGIDGGILGPGPAPEVPIIGPGSGPGGPGNPDDAVVIEPGGPPEYGPPGISPGKPLEPEVCTLGYALAGIFGFKALKEVTVAAKALGPLLKVLKGSKKATIPFIPFILATKLVFKPLKKVLGPLKIASTSLLAVILIPLGLVTAPLWLPVAAFLGIKHLKSELKDKFGDKGKKKPFFKKPFKKFKSKDKDKHRLFLGDDLNDLEDSEDGHNGPEMTSVMSRFISALDDTCIERISCEIEKSTAKMSWPMMMDGFGVTSRLGVNPCEQYSCQNLLKLLENP